MRVKKLLGHRASRTVKTVTTAFTCHFDFRVHLCQRSDGQGVNGKQLWAAETLVQSPISVWHHYWRLQTYTRTDCHALVYMTDTLYIVLCYLHSFKEATTQLTQASPSPRCLPRRHAVCRDPTACWGLKVQWWPVYALRWCKSASGKKKNKKKTKKQPNLR